MPLEEIEEMEGYMDVVRNHREKAFDEGMDAMLKWINACNVGIYYLTCPDNPYRIKEKGKKEKKS